MTILMSDKLQLVDLCNANWLVCAFQPDYGNPQTNSLRYVTSDKLKLIGHQGLLLFAFSEAKI